MYMMKGALVLFISLAIGYGLCVVANKQKKGLLQTVGYVLGTAVIILSLLCSLACSIKGGCYKGMRGKDKKWHDKKMQKYRMMKDKSGMLMKDQTK